MFRTARSVVPCRSSTSRHRASCSKAHQRLTLTQRNTLRRLVTLVHFLAAWKLLPNVSQWVLHTVERGCKIQFRSHPPLFNGVFPTLVGPEEALVREQEVDTLLRKEAIEMVPPRGRVRVFTAVTSSFRRRMGGCVLF